MRQKDRDEAKFQGLVDRLDREVDGMVDEMLVRLDDELPAWSTSARPEFLEPLRRVIADSIHAEIAALRDGRLPEELAPADMEVARETARVGAPVSNLSWGFRAGHALQWHRWLELVDRGDVDRERRRQLLERGSSFFFSYADRMIRMVTEEYARERERLLRSTEQRRFHLVRELLDGVPVDGSSLGYDLDAWHVGMVVWGSGAGDAARALTGAFARQLLLVGVVEETYWGWLSAAEQPSGHHVKSVARVVAQTATRLAVGEPHHGVTGFRRTHRQARDAHRVALGSEERVTSYEDVALVVLAARDEDAARAFVTSELRGLEGEDTRSRRLRQTLAEYLRCGSRAAAAARALGAHEQTIANRVRAIEQRTGRSVSDRQAELVTALALRALLDHDAAG